MKQPAMLATAIVVSLLVSLATTASHGAPAKKAEVFAVVQIGDEIRVVRKSELTGLNKSVAEEDKRRQKAYEASKKGKGMGREMAPEMTKPVKRTVRVLKNSLKTEQDAREWKEKFMDERVGAKISKKADAW